MPPSRRDQILEAIAWRSLDRFCQENPKPRLTPRTKHRCKLWIREQVSGRVNYESVDQETYYLPINDDEGETMLDYARRTLDD